MITSLLGLPARTPPRVLVLGAHSDDIEIGCGGTLLTFLGRRPDAEVTWVVLGAHGRRAQEAERSAAAFLRRCRKKTVLVKGFRDGFFPYTGVQVKEFFEEMKGWCDPDVVFTHTLQDRHQDHRMTADLTWNTYRDHLILEYEVIKYDGDLGAPNLFVQLDRRVVRRKIAHIMRQFATQRPRHWFSEDTFLGLMRVRGVECASPTGYAEAFYCRKIVVSPGKT